MPDFHAKLSPSGSKRWMTCPGSIPLTDELVAKGLIQLGGTSEYAAEGTVGHKIGENLIEDFKAGRTYKSSKYLGRVMKADGYSFTVSKEMLKAVDVFVDYVIDKYYELTFEGYKVEILTERWVSLKHLGIEGLDGGTVDITIIARDAKGRIVYIEVVDYKHGSGVFVPVEDNTQALCYTVGVLHDLIQNTKDEDLHKARIKDVVITICQPRYVGEDPIRSLEVSVLDLGNWTVKELIPKAKKVYDESPEFHPDDEACRFCPCVGNCAARQDMMIEVAMVDFDFADENTPPELPSLTGLTVEQKYLIIKYGPLISKFMAEVGMQVKDEIDKGSKDYIKWLKLVRSKTNRKFTDDAFDEFLSPLFDHLSEEELYVSKTKNLGEIETLLKNKIDNKIAAQVMKDVTTKPEGGKVIADINDKRPAVEPSIVTDFDEL